MLNRSLSLLLWIGLFVAYAVIIFAFVYPDPFDGLPGGYRAPAWAAFMVRIVLFHVGIAALVAALVVAIMRRWWLLLASVPLLLITLGPTAWSYYPKPEPRVAGETIRVMTVNVYYNQNRQTRPIIEEVLAESPDVLLVQEYSGKWHRDMSRALEMGYPVREHDIHYGSFSLGLFSRLPLVEPIERYHVGTSKRQVVYRMLVRIDGRDVAIYTLHLSPPIRPTMYTGNCRQLADLLELADHETIPVILAGDFNFPSGTPQHEQVVRRGYRDVHDIVGHGRRVTWQRGIFPGLRIDHIYLSPELTCVSSTVGVGEGSDHRPVIADIGFRE